MKPSITDVLVVGSGPAGATLARILAEGGRAVTVIDRADHPRRKPCGGGLPARTCAHLPFVPDSVGGCFVREVALDGGMTGRHLFDASGTWVVERSRFDAALLRVACEAGARFLPHTGYLHAERVEDGFDVSTTRGRFRAKVLCGCDGVFSRVARDFGVVRPGYGFCLEGMVPYAPGTTDAARHRAVFRLTAVARGYAWAFPREEGYAVGVGGDFARKPDLRRSLEAFCRKTPELGRGVEDVHGGMLPAYGGALGWYAGAGVYLCGDAAQLVDRLTGEGLYYAVRSGMLAGEALLGRLPSQREGAADPAPAGATGECEHHDLPLVSTRGAGQHDPLATSSIYSEPTESVANREPCASPIPSADGAAGQGIEETLSAQATGAAVHQRGGTPSTQNEGSADHERGSIASTHGGGAAGYGTDAEGASRAYDAAVRAELVVELAYARRCAARVHARHPWTMAVVMGLPRFRAYAGRFVELLSGTTTYAALFASLRRHRNP